GRRRPIGLGKDDVERDRRGAGVSKPRDEASDHIASPRPLADRGQTPLVDVDDDDAGCWRPRTRRSLEQVGRGIVEAPEESRTVLDQECGDDHRHRAAEEQEPAVRPRTRLEHDSIYLTEISTRRFLGSGVLFLVLISRSASPCDATSIRPGATPAEVRTLRTATARFIPSATFFLASPIVSVCPMTTTSGTGRRFTVSTTSATFLLDSAVILSDSNWK